MDNPLQFVQTQTASEHLLGVETPDASAQELYGNHSAHVYASVVAHGNSRLHLGDIHYHNAPSDPQKGLEKAQLFGVCLGRAPVIHPDAFKGRYGEIRQLHDCLEQRTNSQSQSIVSVIGMGGIGKTQLTLAYVRAYADSYSSVFWLNAVDEDSLKQDLAHIASIVFPRSQQMQMEGVDDDLMLEKVKSWFSETGNNKWLLVFDNYDDPNLSGIRSVTGYNIRKYFPHRSQGHIIITTRSNKLSFSNQLRLNRIHEMSTCVSILSNRSRRDLSSDEMATQLAARLAGLPLALATAGTFLASTDVSCHEYIDMYENMWLELVSTGGDELLEYEERTLASTWTISLNQVRTRNEDAPKLLAFLAYFNPEGFTYDLLKGGACDEVDWLHGVTASAIRFQRAVSALQSYSLVELFGRSYCVHPCLHDWLVRSFITPPEKSLFFAAMDCISNAVNKAAQIGLSQVQNCKNLLKHAAWLQNSCFQALWNENISDHRVIKATVTFAKMEISLDNYSQAQKFCELAILGKERAFGLDHKSTLDAVKDLGIIFAFQGTAGKAEAMYRRVLAVQERRDGAPSSLMLEVTLKLAQLYFDEGRMHDASQMLQGLLKDAAVTPTRHPRLFARVCRDLGVIYEYLGLLDQAEEVLLQAMSQRTQYTDLDQSSLIGNAATLAAIRIRQHRLPDAKAMVESAVQDYDVVSAREDLDLASVAYMYAEVLRLWIIVDAEEGGNSRQILLKLIKHVQKWASAHPHILHHLGKAFISPFGDSKNASLAYRHSIRVKPEEGVVIRSVNIRCDGCQAWINPEVGLFVCQECSNIDLCRECFGRYDNGELCVYSCKGHQFHGVDFTSSTVDAEQKLGIDAWFHNIIQQYGGRQDNA